MKILIDTCVVLDYLLNRQPYADSTDAFLKKALRAHATLLLTAKQMTDLYYLTHKDLHDKVLVKQVLSRLLSLIEVVDTTGDDVVLALSSPGSDYEDSVMIETARRNDVDLIVTRDFAGFSVSPIPYGDTLKALTLI